MSGLMRLKRETQTITPESGYALILFNSHLNGSLTILKYHGSGRKAFEPMIEEADIVLTTYHTLVVDYDKKSKPLHNIEWFRVVLDEGK
jgi:SNF2 family DNA or RNA helicase